MERERLGSRLGFILLSAGCAIGVGNVWKFPYMTGQYGGGAFVVVYLLCLILLGVPVMTMEFALGRASQKSPVKLYDALAKKGSKWHLHGYAAMAGNYILMFFYTIVTGWMLRYFVDMATGKFVGASVEEVNNMFGAMMSEPVALIVYMAIVVAVGILVCSLGVQKGVEKISKPMMIALLAIMVILAFNSVFLPGAAEGVKFYLVPDLQRMKSVGIGNVVVGAMNQAFFTLSLGIGSMAIFGSYIGKDRALMGEAVGKAAALAAKHDLTPHGVYTDMLLQLQKLLLNEDCFLPSIPRPVSSACRNAALNAPDTLRNGQDRTHRIYEENTVYTAAKGEALTYTFAPQPIASVHIVFDSDLNRETLPGGWCEQGHSTRAQYLLNSPVMHMPTTLCREFKLIGQKEGVSTELLHVTDNRKRSYHIPVNGEFDTLTLIPLDSWGHKEIPVISFDFS